MKNDLFADPVEGPFECNEKGIWLHPDARLAFDELNGRLGLFVDWLYRRGFEVASVGVASGVAFRKAPRPMIALPGWTLVLLHRGDQPTGIWVRRGQMLPPCPFCAGTPTLFVKGFNRDGGRLQGECGRLDDYGPDGLMAEASVYCHDCGVEGPIAEETIFDGGDYDALLLEGIRLWSERDQRNASAYEVNAAEGRCRYPRRDGA